MKDKDGRYSAHIENWGCITLIIVAGICYIIGKLIDAGVFT